MRHPRCTLPYFKFAALCGEHVLNPLRVASIGKRDYAAIASAKHHNRRSIFMTALTPLMDDHSHYRNTPGERPQDTVRDVQVYTGKPAGNGIGKTLFYTARQYICFGSSSRISGDICWCQHSSGTVWSFEGDVENLVKRRAAGPSRSACAPAKFYSPRLSGTDIVTRPLNTNFWIRRPSSTSELYRFPLLSVVM